MNRVVLAVCAVVVVGATAWAADPPKPSDSAELDKRLNQVAFDAAKAGTKIYNDGDQGGCLKLYEGTLRGLSLALDHRPDLAKEVAARLKEADGQTAVADKAFTLRKALDAVMDQTGTKRALWDRLGGDNAVAKVVNEFVDKAAADKDLDYFRGGKNPSDADTLKNLKTRTGVSMLFNSNGDFYTFAIPSIN